MDAVEKEPVTRKPRSRLPLSELPDDLIFAVCELYVAGGRGATEIRNWLNKMPGCDFTREQVHHMLKVGLDRGYLQFRAPIERELAHRLQDLYGKESFYVRLVNLRTETAHEHVVTEAAYLALSLIQQFGELKDTVHIGLGPGWTTRKIAEKLADLLRHTRDWSPRPRLVLHALSSGFVMNDPRNAPTTFFSFFINLPMAVNYVDLCAPMLVQSTAEYEKVKELPGVRDAFARAKEIDLVITSLARAGDEHGALYQLIQADRSVANLLTQCGWIGEVQHRPYSADGPIRADMGMRAVTLFELDELVELARTPNKAVLLVAGPCGKCKKSKGQALRALLASDALALCTHLVTDVATADDCLG